MTVRDALLTWHNYKERMKYDTTPKVQPDGRIVPVVNVSKFQEIINGASRDLIQETGITSEALMLTLAEVAANAASLIRADHETRRKNVAKLFHKP